MVIRFFLSLPSRFLAICAWPARRGGRVGVGVGVRAEVGVRVRVRVRVGVRVTSAEARDVLVLE